MTKRGLYWRCPDCGQLHHEDFDVCPNQSDIETIGAFLTEHDGTEIQVLADPEMPDLIGLTFVWEDPEESGYVNLSHGEAQRLSDILQEALQVVRRTENHE